MLFPVSKSWLIKSIPILKYPLYSLDLAAYIFYKFPKLKTALIGTNFQTVNEVKKKVANQLKNLLTALL